MRFINYGFKLIPQNWVYIGMVKEVLEEAIDLAKSASKIIETNVLTKSTELKHEVLSLANRVHDLYVTLSKFFTYIMNVVPGDRGEAVYSLSKYVFVVISGGEVAYVRTKPIYLVVSYSSRDKSIQLKSKRLLVDLKRDSLNASYYFVKASITLNNSKDYVERYNELRYVMNKLQKIMDVYLVPLVKVKA